MDVNNEEFISAIGVDDLMKQPSPPTPPPPPVNLFVGLQLNIN
jgi:hypothetical protein